MSYRNVKFRTLSKLLEKHGFTLRTIKGSHRLFTHDQTKTTVMLPEHGAEVKPAFVAATARTLDAKGILDREKFDDELSAVSHNGKSRAAS